MANNSKTLDLVIRVKGAANESIKRINQRLGDMRRRIFNLKTAVAGIGVGLVARDVIKTKNEFVKYQKTLETLEGSYEKANKKWDEMLQFAEETPFSISQVMDSYKTLKAFGLDPTIESMTVLGDTAAALGGSDVLGRIALVLGQIRAQGFMAAQDMNQLANAGINAGQVMKDTFGAARDEVVKLKDNGVDANMVIEALMKNMEEKFGGQMAKMNKEMSGQWEMLISIWDRFKVAIMDSGLYNYINNFLTIINEKIIALRKTGKLDEWAKNISDGVINAFETIAMGLVGFWDFSSPILKKIKEQLTAFYDAFRKLPAWIQEVGIVGAMLLGLRGKIVLFAALDLIARIDKRMSDLQKYTAKGGKGGMRGMIDEQLFREEQAKKGIIWKDVVPNDAADKAEEKKVLSDSQQRLQNFFDKLHAIREKAVETGLKPVSTKPVSTAPVTQIITLSDIEKQKSILARMTADNVLYFKRLEQLFDAGKKTVDEYFDGQIEKANVLYNEKIKLLDLELSGTEKLADQQKIRDTMYSLEKAHLAELIDLERQRKDAASDVQQRKMQAQEIIKDVKTRPSDTGFTLDAEFETERGDMDARHAEEISSLEELLTDKMAIEMGYQDELALLKDVARQQELEKDQLLLDQQTRAMQKRLAVGQEIAGGISQAFDAMYEMSGKKSKEFFYISKAAAIAQATMNTANAITGALGSPPYSFGAIAMAAIIGAMGAVQIAKIAAQSLAAGGLVLGKSPTSTSDDKLINATSGEYMQPVPPVKYYGLGIMEGIKNMVYPRELFSGFSLPNIDMRPKFSYAAGGAINIPTRRDREETEEQPAVNIINVTDPQMIDQYAQSIDGQKSFLNIISQNIDTVKNMLSSDQ